MQDGSHFRLISMLAGSEILSEANLSAPGVHEVEEAPRF
jgi:hypothetical protein